MPAGSEAACSNSVWKWILCVSVDDGGEIWGFVCILEMQWQFLECTVSELMCFFVIHSLTGSSDSVLMCILCDTQAQPGSTHPHCCSNQKTLLQNMPTSTNISKWCLLGPPASVLNSTEFRHDMPLKISWFMRDRSDQIRPLILTPWNFTQLAFLQLVTNCVRTDGVSLSLVPCCYCKAISTDMDKLSAIMNDLGVPPTVLMNWLTWLWMSVLKNVIDLTLHHWTQYAPNKSR